MVLERVKQSNSINSSLPTTMCQSITEGIILQCYCIHYDICTCSYKPEYIPDPEDARLNSQDFVNFLQKVLSHSDSSYSLNMSDIVLDGGEIFNSIVQYFCSIKLFTSLQGKITERKYKDGY